MLHHDETEVNPTAKMMRKVREHAYRGGGIHRMNTAGATYYSFTVFKKGSKVDFVGGWDWIVGLKDNKFSWVLDMSTNSIKKSTYYNNL